MPRTPATRTVPGVLGEQLGGDDERDQRHDDRELVELADRGQRALEPGQPADLAVLEDEVEEQHEQEHAAEGRDARVRLVQQVGVGARLLDRAASSASRTASTGLRLAVMPTMSSGKTSRMPKTAMRMPTVRNIFCQKAFIRSRIVALTTALSKESEISRTTRMATRAKRRRARRGGRRRRARRR